MDRQPRRHTTRAFTRDANSGEWPVGARCGGAVTRRDRAGPPISSRIRLLLTRNQQKKCRALRWHGACSRVERSPSLGRGTAALTSVRVLVLALVLEPLALLSRCDGEAEGDTHPEESLVPATIRSWVLRRARRCGRDRGLRRSLQRAGRTVRYADDSIAPAFDLFHEPGLGLSPAARSRGAWQRWRARSAESRSSWPQNRSCRSASRCPDHSTHDCRNATPDRRALGRRSAISGALSRAHSSRVARRTSRCAHAGRALGIWSA